MSEFKPTNSEVVLQVQNMVVNYGNIEAIHGISFDVKRGQIVSLIGSNGAGKTSVLRAISGLVPVKSGDILHNGKSIANVPAHLIVRKGISQAPEGRGIFLNLTVEENLDLGAYSRTSQPTFKKDYAMDLEHVFSLFPRLKERRKQLSGTMSGGEQQMLAIGRAIMSRPEILLLDEPSLGLAPQIIEKIFEIIVQINKEGKTILLVEQNALQALQIAHVGLVLETGNISIRGAASELLRSDDIRRAYLG
jgi:branched-chain amino acid transport system ATP-binding protein